MAGRLPGLTGPLAWLGVAAALALPASIGAAGLAAGPVPWLLHPDQGLQQPLSHLITCAWVHANTAHLLANLAGLVLLTLLAWQVRVTPATAALWLLSWPLTHMALLLDPRLHSYYGMSGVLHAGATLLALDIVQAGDKDNKLSAIPRWMGWVLLLGIPLKCVLENPHLLPVIDRPDLGMQVAPLSHACGFGVAAIIWLGTRISRGPAKSPP